MICCEKCFKDAEIKAIIRGIGVDGNCEVCNKTNVYIYDTDNNKELIEHFNGLLEIYTPSDSYPADFPREKANLLKDELRDRWDVFTIDKEKVYTLMKNICSEKYSEIPGLFHSPIGITTLYQTSYLEENSLIKTFKWENFVKEIKTVNRFHTNLINKKILEMFCEYATTSYRKGHVFYRGRISSSKGYSIKEMGAPPPGKASDGRANPLGISCLYLANDIETTFHEVRASVYDYVTIGKFELIEDIEVVDFIALDRISPFSTIDIELHAVNKEHLRKISNEIAKPLRRGDSSLDYLPTQYIAEFVKSIGHKGIRFKSTRNEKGFNLAVFNQDLFKCTDVEVYDVKSIIYDYDSVDD
ncbi:RES domain-containing protein [Neobacillus notoginsengisoli]|uniref:RES domain-containing protein n=1 Tax=Neobacillus notoginsengisoli TaxID=1578198 RepID=A0A417YSC9_9BACI|nr:RES family NAD+ phosphorylase [Neobacillus notoginsengisoli]RHW38155.1 RES domain-containing protein [Neobacillus notoginsengisoli]